MKTPPAGTAEATSPFDLELRADVLVEQALVYKQLVVLSVILIVLLLRQLVLS